MLIVHLLLGCSGGTGDPAPPPEVCNPGSAWDGESQAFRDASRAWGLDDLGVSGVRLSAVDFDGDGWPDLAVRRNDNEMWLLRNTGEGSFEDVTEASDIRATRGNGGDDARGGTNWVWADVDNDGDLDVYTGLPADNEGDELSEVLLNQGDGTFDFARASRGVREASQVYAAVFTDVDRDGNVDLFVGNYASNGRPAQDRLLIGDGVGGFRDRTAAWGLETQDWLSVDAINEGSAHSNAWANEACDLNGDGNPELLVSSYGRAPNHLWQHTGDGFTNRSVASGYAFDGNTDWSDNESARCWCTLNPADPGCEGVPAPTLINCQQNSDAFRWNHATDREPYRLGGNSGQTTCADLDNDGHLDLVTSEIVHWDVGGSADPSEILHNQGAQEVSFLRPGNEATGLVRPHPEPTWDDGDITNGVFDFDNDGRLDVYIGATDYPDNRGLLYHNLGGLQFDRVPRRLGIDQPRSHGAVAADFDRDGDLDLVVGHSTARCADDCYDPPHPRLFENLSTGSNFVQLELVGGVGSNRAAIGTRVEVRTDGLLQVHEVDGGGGQFGNQTDLALHFGLGEACEADVTVRWPNVELTAQRFTVGGGYRYRVVQGEDPVVTAPRAPGAAGSTPAAR